MLNERNTVNVSLKSLGLSKSLFKSAESLGKGMVACIDHIGLRIYDALNKKFISEDHYAEAYDVDQFGIIRVKQDLNCLDTTKSPVYVWKYLNRNGETIGDMMFDEASAFDENGIAVVKLNNRYFYFNRMGNFMFTDLAPDGFKEAFPFSCGRGRVCIDDEKWNFVCLEAGFLSSTSFFSARDFRNGFAFVGFDYWDTNKDISVGNYINEAGISLLDWYVFCVSDFNEMGFALVHECQKVNGRYAKTSDGYLIDKKGKPYLKDFSKSMSITKNINQYGLILVDSDEGFGNNYITLEGQPVLDVWPREIDEFLDEDVAVLTYSRPNACFLFRLSDRKMFDDRFKDIPTVKDGIATVYKDCGDENKVAANFLSVVDGTYLLDKDVINNRTGKIFEATAPILID